MKQFLVSLSLFLALLGTSRAATIVANSVSRDDVNTALQSASAGDTVQIPAGSANWTSGITWSAPANVTVIGAGTSATGGGDQTIIQDNYAANVPLMQIGVSSSGVFRLSGITVRSGTGTVKDGGTIQIGGGTIRIDHCHFIASSSANYKMFFFGTAAFGVMDQCILDFTGTNTLFFYNGRDNGTGGGQGNYEWTLPTEFGSANYFYLEDNIFNGNVGGGTYSTRAFDGFTASKVVLRFNNLSQTVLCEHHATGHSGDDRGPRSTEVYGNAATSSLTFDPNFTAVDLSNGTSLVWGNTWNNVFKNIYTFKLVRANNSTYTQQPTPNGWGYAGTQFNGTGSNWDGGTALGTDTLYGYPAIDQVGRGNGNLLTGTFPSKINSSTGTIYWPNQGHEPVYIWNNVGGIVSGWGGAVVSNQAGNNRIGSNRDYYLSTGVQTTPTSPFDGTTGVGFGTLANRPTTCTTGVAYWATDQGSWNQSSSNPYGVQQNGADGVLYKATATNTWTLYYTPYTYPHPLRNTGQVSAPEFSPSAGTYVGAQSVTITSATPGASIRYTTDGSTPTSSVGTVYSTPVAISSTTTLKAIAYDGSLDDSTVTTGVYTISNAGDADVTGTTTVTVELTLP